MRRQVFLNRRFGWDKPLPNATPPEALVEIWKERAESEAANADALAANLREAEAILMMVVMARLGTPHPDYDIRVRDSIRSALDYLPAEWFKPKCETCKHKRRVRHEWMKPEEAYEECYLKRLHVEEVKRTVKFCYVYEPVAEVPEL